MERTIVCMDHSGVVQRLTDHSTRIEKISGAFDVHLTEHRENARLILVTTVTSCIAAGASLLAVIVSLLNKGI